LITNEDDIYYLKGYYDYLHMDFGRPTLLVVQRDGTSLLITPQMEAAMAEQAAQVERISF
jgi:Xaa-Pro aminopeptidase